MSRGALLWALFLSLLVAGCASSTPGSPAVGAPSTGSVIPIPPTGAVSTGGIDVGAGFDPCTGLTREQANGLALAGPTPGTAFDSTRSCIWTHYLSEPIETYSVSGRDDIGIADIDTSNQQFKVNRYSAVIARSRLANYESSCLIFVDVRPGQVLQVAYSYTGTRDRMTSEIACSKARPVAELVVANLERGGR